MPCSRGWKKRWGACGPDLPFLSRFRCKSCPSKTHVPRGFCKTRPPPCAHLGLGPGLRPRLRHLGHLSASWFFYLRVRGVGRGAPYFELTLWQLWGRVAVAVAQALAPWTLHSASPVPHRAHPFSHLAKSLGQTHIELANKCEGRLWQWQLQPAFHPRLSDATCGCRLTPVRTRASVRRAAADVLLWKRSKTGRERVASTLLGWSRGVGPGGRDKAGRSNGALLTTGQLKKSRPAQVAVALGRRPRRGRCMTLERTEAGRRSRRVRTGSSLFLTSSSPRLA